MCFFLIAQYAYRRVLNCPDALQIMSHHLEKSFVAGLESYIVQLAFSAPFDRVSHMGLLLKLRFVGVSGSVLSICREFLFNRRQRVVIDGATSEWIPIVLGFDEIYLNYDEI